MKSLHHEEETDPRGVLRGLLGLIAGVTALYWLIPGAVELVAAASTAGVWVQGLSPLLAGLAILAPVISLRRQGSLRFWSIHFLLPAQLLTLLAAAIFALILLAAAVSQANMSVSDFIGLIRLSLVLTLGAFALLILLALGRPQAERYRQSVIDLINLAIVPLLTLSLLATPKTLDIFAVNLRVLAIVCRGNVFTCRPPLSPPGELGPWDFASRALEEHERRTHARALARSVAVPPTGWHISA